MDNNSNNLSKNNLNSEMQSKNQINNENQSNYQKKNTEKKEKNLLEKEKLKEDNERLKSDVEILSKKLHDAVSRIGNLEKALAKKESVNDLKVNIEEENKNLQNPTIETINSKTISIKPKTTTNEFKLRLDTNVNSDSGCSSSGSSPLMYSTTTTTTTTTTTSSIKAGKIYSTSKNSSIKNDSKSENNINSNENDNVTVTTIKDLENTIDILNRRLLDEVERRSELECSHSALVQETEDLTVKLFEEAQTMVATEKRQLFEKNKQVNQLKSIIEEKDNIIQALMLENKTLKQYVQQKIQIPEARISWNNNSILNINSTTPPATPTPSSASSTTTPPIPIPENSSIKTQLDTLNEKDEDRENEKIENESENEIENSYKRRNSNNKKTQPISINTQYSYISDINNSKENDVKLLLATSPFSPSNGIFSISPEIDDDDKKSYQTYAFQTIYKQMNFDNKNIYYNEILNFVKYNHYELIEHSKFAKKCIVEEIEPCMDFQPINSNLLNITTKLNHYNRVRRVAKACKDCTIIIQNIYEYPETNNEDQSNQKIAINNINNSFSSYSSYNSNNSGSGNNISCSLCLRDNLSLPLLRCFMDDDDKEAQTKAAKMAQNSTNSVHQYMYVCPYCKERILCVSDFYGCLKYIKNLKKNNTNNTNSNKINAEIQESCHKIYGDLLRIRERIYWAKIGLISQDSGLNIGGLISN